jgi:hypothetical protein
MRITAVICARVCLWMHWSSWKRWLYLTTFLLTSSHLFFSERFLPTLRNQMDTDVSEPGTTWSNRLLERKQKNQENTTSSAQQLNNLNKSTIFTGESDSNQSTTKKSTNDEANQRLMKEQVNNSSSSLEEKERRYRLRSERIKRVCLSRGVVSNPPIFTMSNKQLPIQSSGSTHLLSGKN